MPAEAPEPFPNFINSTPREILYQILSLCDKTHDVVRSSRDCTGNQSFGIGRGCGSRALSRVCHLWKSCVEAGMIPSKLLREIQLTDSQFLQINSNFSREQTSPPERPVTSESEPSILRGYHTITVIYRNHREDPQSDLSASSISHATECLPQILAPKVLNLVITDGRTTDTREVLGRFRTSRRSIRDTLHDGYFASREPLDECSHINIIVWDGRLCNIPLLGPHMLPPVQLPLGMPPGFGRVDLYINHWTDPDSVGDIPWVFGQLCRGARPHTLGFHLMSPHGSTITDQWHIQKVCTGLGNTLLRNLHVSGIGSDGFLRLLQCSAIQVWSIRVLEISLPIHLADECFWDWRIFEKETWPVYKEHRRSFLDDDGDQGTMAFPQLTLDRLVDGKIEAVEKGRMESLCQIAYFGPDPAAEWNTCGRAQNDIECFAGRSLSWASLELVVAGGQLVYNVR